MQRAGGLAELWVWNTWSGLSGRAVLHRQFHGCGGLSRRLPRFQEGTSATPAAVPGGRRGVRLVATAAARAQDPPADSLPGPALVWFCGLGAAARGTAFCRGHSRRSGRAGHHEVPPLRAAVPNGGSARRRRRRCGRALCKKCVPGRLWLFQVGVFCASSVPVLQPSIGCGSRHTSCEVMWDLNKSSKGRTC
jgi:hypothetical protein